jgi:hypothetical protein
MSASTASAPISKLLIDPSIYAYLLGYLHDANPKAAASMRIAVKAPEADGSTVYKCIKANLIPLK